jgi:hypothetical protein
MPDVERRDITSEASKEDGALEAKTGRERNYARIAAEFDSAASGVRRSIRFRDGQFCYGIARAVRWVKVSFSRPTIASGTRPS